MSTCDIFGYKSVLSDGFEFAVPIHYFMGRVIGQGSYGVVCSGYDSSTKKKIAVKKLQRLFSTISDCQRSYRELKILKWAKHKNIIGLVNAYIPNVCVARFDELYLVTDLMTTTLKAIRDKTFHNDRLSYFLYQVLSGLKYLHTSGIVHRDLKPSNITVKSDNSLKIIDFGMARTTHGTINTTCISNATFAYRAPEMILSMNYKEKVDMWAVGTIFAELVHKFLLFEAQQRLNRVILMFQTLGTPRTSFLEKIPETYSNVLGTHTFYPGKSFDEIFDDSLFRNYKTAGPCKSKKEDFRDLLSKMLKIDPDERISAEEALTHNFLNKWLDESDLIIPTSVPYDPNFVEGNYTKEQWRLMIFNEIMRS